MTLRIAFITDQDWKNINIWSGSLFHMSHALKKVFSHVEIVQVQNFSSIDKPTEEALKAIGREATERVSQLEVNAIICHGTSALPYLETKLPLALWHDSTWSALYQGHFDEVLDFKAFGEKYPNLKNWDKLALERASFIFFAAGWLRDVAWNHYGTDLRKIHIVPFGANLEGAQDRNELDQILASRQCNICNLAFLGEDWERKGLRKAVELTKRLINLGLNVQLNVIGCAPDDPNLHTSSAIKYHGYLNKNDPAQLKALQNTLKSSHFLVHPASFECFGCALAEANSFGVPVLAAAVTGPVTIVKEGLNGYLFSLESFEAEAARVVKKTFEQYHERYLPLAITSFQEYKDRLNWTAGAQKIHELLAKV
jgi:glycosyltransferase involved in cell wall biosynthesis